MAYFLFKETNESEAESEVTSGGDIVEAMAHLHAFVLANESRPVILPRCTQRRARLESSMEQKVRQCQSKLRRDRHAGAFTTRSLA